MRIKSGLTKDEYIKKICSATAPFCKRHHISCTVNFLDAETIFLDFSNPKADRVNKTLAIDFEGLITHKATWRKFKRYIKAFLRLAYNI